MTVKRDPLLVGNDTFKFNFVECAIKFAEHVKTLIHEIQQIKLQLQKEKSTSSTEQKSADNNQQGIVLLGGFDFSVTSIMQFDYQEFERALAKVNECPSCNNIFRKAGKAMLSSHQNYELVAKKNHIGIFDNLFKITEFWNCSKEIGKFCSLPSDLIDFLVVPYVIALQAQNYLTEKQLREQNQTNNQNASQIPQTSQQEPQIQQAYSQQLSSVPKIQTAPLTLSTRSISPLDVDFIPRPDDAPVQASDNPFRQNSSTYSVQSTMLDEMNIIIGTHPRCEDDVPKLLKGIIENRITNLVITIPYNKEKDPLVNWFKPSKSFVIRLYQLNHVIYSSASDTFPLIIGSNDTLLPNVCHRITVHCFKLKENNSLDLDELTKTRLLKIYDSLVIATNLSDSLEIASMMVQSDNAADFISTLQKVHVEATEDPKVNPAQTVKQNSSNSAVSQEKKELSAQLPPGSLPQPPAQDTVEKKTSPRSPSIAKQGILAPLKPINQQFRPKETLPQKTRTLYGM